MSCLTGSRFSSDVPPSFTSESIALKNILLGKIILTGEAHEGQKPLKKKSYGGTKILVNWSNAFDQKNAGAMFALRAIT
jgi:hypothetical protein